MSDAELKKCRENWSHTIGGSHLPRFQRYNLKQPDHTRVFSNSKNAVFATSIFALVLVLPLSAHAAAPDETAFVLNTFGFLIWGILVMWMCAGFTMLESGCVRAKNVSVICLKNIGLYSIASLAYYVIGYNIMYVDVEPGGWFGSLDLFFEPSAAEQALLQGAAGAMGEVLEQNSSAMSNWFFQMVFVATTASIISGTLAERVKLWTFFLFVLILTAAIYPVVGAWTWGGGWLAKFGFQDFAGSTIVHSTGGWAALTGAILLGPRRGKFRQDGTIKPMPPSNVPIVALGVFILWLGWFGFNGGSQLAFGSAPDAVAISNILANTNIAAASGVLAALCLSRPVLGRVDLMAALNGAIAGLVAITAGPDLVENQWALLIGAVGGVIAVTGTKALDKLGIDDVVGAVPAHLFAGIWGTLAVCFAAGGTLWIQLVGILAIGFFVLGSSGVVWFFLGRVMGLRVSEQAEELGQDLVELGIEAYPEFVAVPEDTKQ